MKVLLINLPNRYQDKSRKEVFFPVGLGYIAGALIEEKHEVTVLDIYALDLPEEKVASIIRDAEFDVVGISAMSTQYKYTKWISSEIKKSHKDKKIILGWVLATHSAEIVLKTTDVDICVIDEGEHTIKELLASLDRLTGVRGIAYKNYGKVEVTPRRDQIKELGLLPRIPYEIFPMDIYIDSLSRCGVTKKQRTINISCGRGCPYDCTFCSKSFFGTRLRPVKDIIEEIVFLKARYNIERIFFSDELLVINKARIMEICENIAPLKINWSCQGRINLVDEEILLRMKQSGCTAIGYGVESASQKILNAMNKRINVEKAEEIIKLTKKVGLTPIIQYTFGYPGEDRETIKNTIDFFDRIDESSIQLSPITPLPGSKLWKYCVDNNIVQDEVAFMEKLEGGYMPDSPTMVNFTSFTNEELNRLRSWSENQIRLNYIKKHPLHAFGLIKKKLMEEGFSGTYKKIMGFIEKNMVCQKECP